MAAKAFAARGANLGIIARNQSKAQKTSTVLRMQTKKSIKIDIFIADLSSQSSIRKVTEQILERNMVGSPSEKIKELTKRMLDPNNRFSFLLIQQV